MFFTASEINSICIIKGKISFLLKNGRRSKVLN